MLNVCNFWSKTVLYIIFVLFCYSKFWRWLLWCFRDIWASFCVHFACGEGQFDIGVTAKCVWCIRRDGKVDGRWQAVVNTNSCRLLALNHVDWCHQLVEECHHLVTKAPAYHQLTNNSLSVHRFMENGTDTGMNHVACTTINLSFHYACTWDQYWLMMVVVVAIVQYIAPALFNA